MSECARGGWSMNRRFSGWSRARGIFVSPGALAAAFLFAATVAFGAAHVTVYLQPFGVDLQTQGSFALGEEVPVEVRGAVEGSQVTNWVGALTRGTNVVATCTNLTMGTNGVATGSVDCATVEMGALFKGASPLAERDVTLTFCESFGTNGDFRLVASGSATVRNNPLSPEAVAGFAPTGRHLWDSALFEAMREWAVSNLATRAWVEETIAGSAYEALGFDPWAECAGGWHWPDFFTWEARPGRYGATWRGAAVSIATNNSVVARIYTNTAVRGWVLESKVYRQQAFEDRVAWSTPETGIEVAEEDGTWYVDFSAGFDPEEQEGESFTVSGRLGGYEATAVLEATNVARSAHREFVRAAPGSVPASAWHCVVEAADGAPQGAQTATWTGTRGDASTWAWNGNCWLDSLGIAAFPVSLRADWGGTTTGYRPLTLVTPRHAVAAKHWCPSKGSTNWWMDGNGSARPGVVDSWVDIRSDLRLVRLAEAVQAPLAMAMPDKWAGFFFGDSGGASGVPGVPVVSLDASEQARVAWWTPGALMRGSRTQEDYYGIHGNDGAWTDGRFDAPDVPGVGGDSGSPAFLAVEDDGEDVRLVLLGCFWHGSDGPLPTAGELNRAIAGAWPMDAERVEAADFGGWGYTDYLEGELTPW